MPAPENDRDGRFRIEAFRIDDYDRVMDLWAAGGLPLKPRGRDSRENIAKQIGLPNVRFLVAATGRAARSSGPSWPPTTAGRAGSTAWPSTRPCGDRGSGPGSSGRPRLGSPPKGMDILACLIEDGNAVSMSVFETLGYKKHPEIIYFAKRKYPGV